MLRLKPVLEVPPRECPHCHSIMAASDYLITGMRNLAEFLCPQCSREYYGDMPAGQALYTPILLDKTTGAVWDNYQAGWFSEWLAASYHNRTKDPLLFETITFSKLKKKVVLLNCLDTLYGHSLLKLLNAQYYLDHCINKSLIVMLPRSLVWMLPEGVAEAWIADLPPGRGTEWNDWLADEISNRLKDYPDVSLAIAFSHPNPTDFDIERFTGVSPLPIESLARHDGKPVITFVWRDDRRWEANLPNKASHFHNLKRRLELPLSGINRQMRTVLELAENLRSKFPLLDFAVAGLGSPVGLPDWISDLTTTRFDSVIERELCKRYAESHIIIGVHGSNMLLPSAHSLSVIELSDRGRAGNYLQDILFRISDPRDTLFRYRFMPDTSSPEDVALTAATILRYNEFRKLMGTEYVTHDENYDYANWLSSTRRA